VSANDPRLALGAAAEAVETRLELLDRARFVARLWSRDDALWGDDPARRAVAANRLGWLDSPARMRGEVAALRAFAREVAADGFTHAVLLGMGGSSLAPEMLRLTYGVAPGALELTVLDNTSPAAVRAVSAAHDPKRTLFVVSSKSGGTLEVASFERHFFEWTRAARPEAGRAFVAVTDPGTPLERLAAERGYRRVFAGIPDIGGRYSALSPFGLVPGALIGLDLDALLDAARDEARASGPEAPATANPAVRLGAALGELALAGADKLTLVLGPEIAALGSWIEQLVAESTGKEGRGIVPVADEALGPPSVYGNDRVFVSVSVGAPPPATTAALAALEAAGHPVLRWTLASALALGGECLRWEIATATAGAVIDVDPFDEPNVTEAKQASRAVLDEYLAAGRFPEAYLLASAAGLEIEAPTSVADALEHRVSDPADPAAWAASLISMARPGDYFALCAYLHRTPARHARLERLRTALRDPSRLATTLGYGPRFLHSTGQLHKGGPNSGIFMQLTADEGEELAIPGERYGFGALRRAQAAGDYEVLERRRRRVMRVHLGSEVEPALDRLIAAVTAGARA
jgi:transaldolase/glucose-6-phosphate isomerase